MDNRPRQVPANPMANGAHASGAAAAGAAGRMTGRGAAAAPGRNPNAPVPVSSRPIPVQNTGRASATTEEDEEGEDRLWTDFFKQAPAWLVSASFHTFVLIILGIWAAVAVHQKVEEVEISAEPMRYAETLGDQLMDPSVTEGGASKDMVDPSTDKQILTAQNLPYVDDPFAAPMPASEIALNGKWAASDIEAPSIGLAAQWPAGG